MGVNEAKNYVLSRLLDVNLWEGITSFCYHDSHSARLGPVFGEPSCNHWGPRTPDLLHFQDQVADYR